jgi:CcmD family protein
MRLILVRSWPQGRYRRKDVSRYREKYREEDVVTYLAIGYLVLWGLTFGYVFSIVARQKRLERDIALLLRERGEDADRAEG